MTEVPFSLPAHRTGQAVFPHPALGQGSTRLDRETSPCGSPPSDLERCERDVGRLAPLSLVLFLGRDLLELGPLSSTGVTRLPRSYDPLRLPDRPPSL